MRVGYGKNRIEKEFAHADCDRIWIDGDHTDRRERSFMLGNDLRNGDTLVLLAKGDLGHGGELTIIYRALADRSIAVEVSKPPKADAKPRGRPRKFDPAPEADKEIAALWSDPLLYTPAYVMRRAEELTGAPVNRNALFHRYGKRG